MSGVARLLWAVAVLLIAMPLRLFGAEAVWSTEELMSRRNQWDALVDTPIRVEGRVSTLGRTSLRLLKCPLTVDATEQQVHALSGARGVEVMGHLKRDGTRFRLEARDLRPRPTDSDEFRRRLQQLKPKDVDDYFALGAWAAGRGKFYEDETLVELAGEAYRAGLAAEREQMDAPTVAGVRALSAKAAEYGLSAEVQREYLHESYVLETQTLRDQDARDPAVLLTLEEAIAKTLPGAAEPLAKPDAALQAKYSSAPVGTYKGLPPQDRRRAHRFLYAAVALLRMQTETARQGGTGKAWAERMESQFPDFPEHAATAWRDYDRFRLNRLATSTREEVQQLVHDLRERRQPEVAQKAVRDWLRARETTLRPVGAHGLVQLAEDTLALTGDRRMAAAYLVEADRLDPAQPEAATLLAAWGYQRVGNRWQSPDDPAGLTPAAPALQATPAEQLTVGMKPQEVRGLLGTPTSVARVLTSRDVLETWLYGDFGTSRLTLMFQRSRQDSRMRLVKFELAP